MHMSAANKNCAPEILTIQRGKLSAMIAEIFATALPAFMLSREFRSTHLPDTMDFDAFDFGFR